MKIHLAYFSATYTTRTVCREVAKHLGNDIIEYDLTNDNLKEPVEIPAEDLLILGIPVYSGRMPQLATERLNSLKGNSGRAIALAVYGNREFDDALMEMSMWLQAHNFTMIAAAAFIGRHCIFHNVATNRPDDADRLQMKAFAQACMPLLNQPLSALTLPEVPGNTELPPYKRAAFRPLPDDTCSQCGKCAELCPTGAISPDDVSIVDADKCLACGRCIVVCPTDSRNFCGEMYEQMSVRFTAAFGANRKEPVFFLAQTKA